MVRYQRVLALLAVLALSLASNPALAGGKGGGGGGGGGGGSTKPLTIRYTGLVTAMIAAPEGVYLTVGTSYYNTGTVLITPDTRIKLNGDSSATIEDVWMLDTVQVDAFWPSRIADKMEVIGLRP